MKWLASGSGTRTTGSTSVVQEMWISSLAATTAQPPYARFSRGTGREVKSTVRLIGDAAAIVSFHEHQEESWITNRIRDTCQILAPNSKIDALGITIGIRKDRDDSFEERINKLHALRGDLADIEDAGIELLLGRLCANTTKVLHVG